MRRKEDRSEDVQRAQAACERGDLAGAINILCGLAYEDEYEYVDHDLRAGRKDQSRDDFQDFKVENESWTLRSRKQLIQEIGNPAQILMGRAGPDNAEFNHEVPQEPTLGSNLGHIAWRAYNPDDGWPHDRVCQLYSRYAGRHTGSMHFQTGGEDRFIIHPNGQLEMNGPLFVDERGAYLPLLLNGVMRKL